MLFVEVQYIFKVLSHNMYEKTKYMNVNNIKSYKYLVLQFDCIIPNLAKFLVNKYDRSVKEKGTNTVC